MILLALLAVAGIAFKCNASILPGTPPSPVIENDEFTDIVPVPWLNERQDLPPPIEQWGRQNLPPPTGPWEKVKTEQGEDLFESDIVLTAEQLDAVRQRKAINYEGSRWPEGSDGYPKVPYVYYDSSVDRAAVKAGIDHWEEHTCIKFEETTNTNQAHLQFFKGGGCWSYVGVSSSTGQQVSIDDGCTSLGTVAHEIGHAMGFWHEQSRTDRDDHVAIKLDNVIEKNKHNFDKHDTNNYDVKYDYSSDMHYGSFYFHKNGKMTIVTKDPFAQELIASRAGLSHRDKLLANKMYKCIDKWASKCGIAADTCKNEGYLGANCVCVCPPGTSGDKCETVSTDYYAHLRSEHSETITTEKTFSHVGDAKFAKKIVAPECKLVKLTFTSFDLYKKVTSSSTGLTYCYYEYIFLRFGKDLTEGDIYCEKDIAAGQSFTSEIDTMVLFSESKYSGISDGWSAKVEFVSDPGCTPATTTTTITTTTTTTTTATLVECAVKKPKVQKLKSGESIQIQSPNFPNKYPGSTKKCEWKVKGDGIESVKISCYSFEMEAPNKNLKCKDYLQIGTKKYCGDDGPIDITVSVKKAAKLKFKSNKRKSGMGFSCYVTATSDDKTTTAKPTETTTTAKPTENPTTCKCGQKKAGTRIINGKETEVLEYPWQAGIVSTGSARTWCGGSLINSNWVLTAAHCTVGTSASSIQVLLAEHDLTVSESHTERFNVKRIINHPNYVSNPWTNGHDISLLELNGRVNFETSQARPICLPTGQNDYDDQLVTLTGFGRIGHDQAQSNYLREVDIHVISNLECSWVYGGSESDYNTMICAGEQDGTGGCMGDSGGPLIVKEGNHYEQVGVVSFGSSYCNSYGVFARVTDLRGWIDSYASTGNPDTCSP